ncbi:MAG: hypothetical protein IJ960_09615 [Oscillospiraceae bacterium]|nr:hypothetical protein [Oscillospiraceae bacterium]
MDLLYDAAMVWNHLLGYKYDIVCGRSGVLYPISLDFEASEFYHLAGFPHMKDIVLPVRFSQKQTLSKVLKGTVKESMIVKSDNYEPIIRRKLEALTQLEELLNSPFQVYQYDRWKSPFYTEIRARYLLVDEKTQVVFLFTDTSDGGATYFARSTFVMDHRDFRKGQTKLTVLKINRTELATGREDVIYCREGFASEQ